MNLMPEKCAARVSPPTLVLFYKDTNTGKRRRRSMPLRKFTADVNIHHYAERLCSDKRNGQYVKLIPLTQLESVLSRIKSATTKLDKLPSKLEPLELPSPVGKRGKLQPLTHSTTKNLEADLKIDKLLQKSKDGNELESKYGSVDDSSNVIKNSDKSNNHGTGLSDAINDQRTVTADMKDSEPFGSPDNKATAKSDENSLQLSSASIPEIMEGDDDDDDDDFENLTQEGILEKLIALPSNSDEENDLNKVSDEVLKQKKKEMDQQFEQNQLKPGDEGYKYDKEIDFDDNDKVSCGWDSNNSDIEDF